MRTIHGVTYYNDSKGTNVDASMKALEAFPQGHLILIAGGYDKKTPLDDFMALAAKRVDTLILIGDAAERFEAAAKKAGIQDIAVLVTAWKGPSCWPAKSPRHRRPSSCRRLARALTCMIILNSVAVSLKALSTRSDTI